MSVDRLKRCVIKEELVALTGDFMKAVILQQMLYWSERVSDYDNFALEENRRIREMQREEHEEIELKHGWIYKTSDDLAAETMLGSAVSTMRKYLKELIADGYLQERQNPKYAWDRTKQYRVDVVKIQRDLYKLGYFLEGYTIDFSILLGEYAENDEELNETSIFDSEKSIFENENLKSQTENSKIEFRRAIPEITTKTTTETTKKIVDSLRSSTLPSGQVKNLTVSPLEKASKVVTGNAYGSDQKVPIDVVVQTAAQRSSISRDRKANRPTASSERKVPQNANTIITYYREEFKRCFGGTAPVETGKDRKLMKMLIENYGYDTTISMVDWVFANWAQFKRECRLTSVPTIGIMFGFIGYIQEQLGNVIVVRREKSDNAWGY